MVRLLGPKESLGSIRKSRWARCTQQSWLRRVVTIPRRQPTSQAAPAAHLSLASGVPLVVGWSHTVTSGAHHGASLWFTTLCALSVALGALSYNLMAVLAEFFHFERRSQQVQARTYLHGVDVTHSRFFQIPAVLAAVEFAAEAHQAQRRKTGEPYVTHCIETALIVEACLPTAHNSAAEQQRHVCCIMAAVLHDVIDDTPTDLSAMQLAFGPRVAALVNQVSKLSQMNQLLRRGKRQGWAQYSPDHFKQLRKLIVDLAFEEPLVILVKLADRLHNMRTVYVLPPDKQRSVAEETLEVWCSMAESLGWDGLKSEMEDLCFAVLQPSTYCTLRAELDRLWSLPTLAVVEEQLDEQDQAAAAGGGGGGGGGDGSDGLGLRIVQVSGPEAPVRHYTRAAGVRAAAAATAAAGGAADGGYGWLQQRRRQRRRRVESGRADAEAEAEELGRARALAAERAVAAAAVPLPPPLPTAAAALQSSRPALAEAGVAAVPAMAVATVAEASSSSAAVVVWEADPGGGERMRGDGGGGSMAAAAAATTAAVAVVVVEAEAEVPSSTSRGLSYADGDGGGDGDGSSASTPSPSGAAAVATIASSYATPYTPSSSPGAAATAADGWGCAASTAYRNDGAAATASGHSSNTTNSTCPDIGRGAGFRLSGNGGGSVATGARFGPPADAAFALPSYGTLESVDGPLLLDGLVLPFGLTATATTTTAADSGDGTDGGGGASSSSGGRELLRQADAPLKPSAAAAAAVDPAPDATPAAGQVSKPAGSGLRAQPPSSAGKQSQPQPPAPAAAAAASDAGISGGGGGGGPLSDVPPAPSLPLSPLSPQQERLKLILSTVVPFESVSFKNLRGLASSTRRGLDVLDECAALLYNEIQIRSQAGGLGINIQGRLKSLHSVYRKMVRKNVAVAQVYDSRALRVIVDDGEGSSLQEAIDVCYRLVNAVHSIWKPIKREFDDYIANPKQSGYQALHTAVRGPGGIPMEVQIKTSSMHELAEYGAAAHWVYKEYTPLLQSPGRGRGSGGGGGGAGGGGRERLPEGYVGQPVLKVAKDKLRYGVIVSRHDDGQRLISAVKLGATFRTSPTRVPDYGFYSSLLAYTRVKRWQVPGHGDLVLRLEEYVKCDDGRYHRRDHLGYLIPAETITLLEGFEEDAAAAQEAEERLAAAAATAAAATAAEVGGGAGGGGGSVDEEALAAAAAAESSSSEQRRFREQMRVTFAKTQQLRSMIAWGDGAIGKYAAADYQSDEVSVLIWPGGRIEHFVRGTTAGDIVAEKGIITTGEGYDGYRVNLLINVNNRLVPEDTVLNDGDLVILSREKVRI
ncbi:hypothetical protein PLESTM_001498700 [Pleodorina starrii]|nr:hypothetical protein PLESTM_001498700 [Pleodorina starrii]